MFCFRWSRRVHHDAPHDLVLQSYERHLERAWESYEGADGFAQFFAIRRTELHNWLDMCQGEKAYEDRILEMFQGHCASLRWLCDGYRK